MSFIVSPHLSIEEHCRLSLQAWQNPCFKATDKDILMLDADGHPNIIPKEITSNMLQELRVFQQIDRKFIAAMAGDALVIIDQVRTCGKGSRVLVAQRITTAGIVTVVNVSQFCTC
jgi:DNA mismatch repair ATPase MutL